MIGTINSLVSKVVGTVSPYVTGTRTVKATGTGRKAAKTARKTGKSKTARCRTKKCKGSSRKCRC